MKTNIGGRFLTSIDRLMFSKIVNRSTVQLSYKCMPNFKAFISRHNQILLTEELSKTVQVTQEPGCNCSSGLCPLVTKNCIVDHVIYRATVKDDNQITNTYTGVTRNTFKKRYYGHNYSFHHRGEKSTALSSYLWNLKDQNKNYEIS